MTTVALLVLSGVVAGLIGSLLGLGGGILIVPILALGLKIPMHNAIATSLLCVVATSSAAASRNLRIGSANYHLGITLELFTVIGAIVGSAVAGILNDVALMSVFAVAMILMSYPMLRQIEAPPPAEESGLDRTSFGARIGGSYHDPAAGGEITYAAKRLPLLMGTSSAAGVLSGLLGIGGGLIKVPIMTLFCGIPMKAAAATSNFMIGVTAVASAMIYYARGEVAPVVTAACVLGVFIGSRTGSRLAPRIHGNALRRMFAVIMILIALQLLMKAGGISIR